MTAAASLRILIVSTSYVADEPRKNLVEMWAGLHNKVNPDCDVVLIDSNSPFDPAKFLRGWGYDSRPVGADPEWDPAVSRRRVLSFPDNIGHLNITGQDGWGRAMSKGIQIAIDGGYDYVFYNDSDALFARPAREVVDRLHRSGVKVAAPMVPQYLFMAQEVLFASVPYLRDLDLIGKYDWAGRAGSVHGPADIPEYRFEQIFGDDYWQLPYRVIRDDQGHLSIDSLTASFPYGIDCLHHASNPALYAAFLKRNGIQI